MKTTNSQNTISVGFWRPLIETRDTIPFERNGQWYIEPRVVQTLDDSGDVQHARRELAEHHAGTFRRYVETGDIERHGSVEAYLTARLARAVERAQIELALPVPVADTLDAGTAERLARWLEAGKVVASIRGQSHCRICGVQCGFQERERGGYRYPSGLVHYVRDHRVAVPGLDLAVLDRQEVTP